MQRRPVIVIAPSFSGKSFLIKQHPELLVDGDNIIKPARKEYPYPGDVGLEWSKEPEQCAVLHKAQVGYLTSVLRDAQEPRVAMFSTGFKSLMEQGLDKYIWLIPEDIWRERSQVGWEERGRPKYAPPQAYKHYKDLERTLYSEHTDSVVFRDPTGDDVLAFAYGYWMGEMRRRGYDKTITVYECMLDQLNTPTMWGYFGSGVNAGLSC